RGLDVRAAAVARSLAARGIGAGDVVAVAAPRSVDAVVALHAVARTGAAYLPVDASLPRQRIAYMLGDARPAAVIAETAAAAGVIGAAAPDGVEMLDLAELVRPCGVQPGDPGTGETGTGEAGADADVPLPVRPVRPEHPAYVLYTSGSTGTPKGVVVPQRAIANRLRWMQDVAPLTADDRVLAKTPATFDVSAWELLAPFVAGAALVVAPPEAHRDASAVARLIGGHGVTLTHFVTSMLDELLARLESGGGSADGAGATGSLRRIVCSGEALPARTIARTARVLPGVRLDNLYGPTEAAVEVTMAADLTRAPD